VAQQPGVDEQAHHPVPRLERSHPGDENGRYVVIADEDEFDFGRHPRRGL